MITWDKFPVVLVGLSKSDAFKKLAEFHITYRIAEEDGVMYKASSDANNDRANLFIRDRIIADCKFY